MISILNRRSAKLKTTASTSASLSLFGAIILFSNICAAQDDAQLSNLVFVPVLRSSAADSNISLSGRGSSDDRALLNSVNEYLTAIEPLRQANSSEPELIEQLAYLGVAYQGLDRHAEAIEAFEEAIALTVVNGGPDNLQQIPLQEQKIPSYLALDDIRSVDDTEEFIYSLKQRHYNPASREMYVAAINLADWNTTAYFRENYGAGNQALRRQRAVINRAPRAIGGGANAIFNGDIKNVFDQDINDARLRKIDRLYKDYQDAISDTGNAELEILVDIAKRIARLAFVTKQEMDFERDNYTFDPNYEGSREQATRNSPRRMDESYESGAEALKYIINILSSVEGLRPEALAAAHLDLGDWHLSYGKAQAAKLAYRDAYQALVNAGFSTENIDRALATDMPPRIPVFATHLHTRTSRGMNANAELDFEGYVDLSYTIDDLGNAAKVQFIESSSENSSRIERLIEVQLRSTKFRPVLTAGELNSPGTIEARYYYAY